MTQVSYRGLWHFMRAKKHVVAAAEVVAEAPTAPTAARVAPALRGFLEATPGLPRGEAQAYFLALVAQAMAERGVAADALGMYLLDQSLSRLGGLGAAGR